MSSSSSLYIHIPFCVSKCDYCDFFSVPSGKSSVPDNYISAVLNETAYRAEKYGVKSWKTVYIGGGTPSLLSEKQLKALVLGIGSLFQNNQIEEISVEMNPSDVTAEKLAAAAECGVTRISCGIQAADGKILSAVHRRSGAQDVTEALECIRRNWKGIFSVDMIAALPGQTEKQLLSGLEKIVSYRPEHVSLYSLTVEENTPLGKLIESGNVSYDYDEADRLWISGRDFLVKKGYRQYEVSNFCFPGFECRHNLTYWRLQDYIGTGSGATGTMYGKETERWTNSRNISEYINFWLNSPYNAEKIPQVVEKIDEETQAFEFFMMGLRTTEGVSSIEYEKRFGRKMPKNAVSLFEQWEKCGKAEIRQIESGKQFSLTSEGILFLNKFLESI